jgi:taurine dioxygenase
MKIQIHDNGWTVMVEDIDLKEVTQEQINILGRHLAEKTVLVFRDQKLTPDDEIKICGMFGKLENFDNEVFKKTLHQEGGKGHIIRVTGELDEHGNPGLFGHVHELIWHCNRVAVPERKPLVWLYGERGTAGSRTSWLNTIFPYNDLSQEEKDEYENYYLDVGPSSTFMEVYSDNQIKDITYHYPKLVHTGLTGIKGLFFPYYQIHFIKDMDKPKGREILDKLWKHVEQEKYMYHHDWRDGDVVIADQWQNIHKRWEFQDIDKRVLHRLAMDYSNIKF